MNDVKFEVVCRRCGNSESLVGGATLPIRCRFCGAPLSGAVAVAQNQVPDRPDHLQRDADASELLLNMLRRHRALLLDEYNVERTISRGDFGSVYLVKRKADGDQFVLKAMRVQGTMNETSLERFRREIGVLKQLKHDGIVPFVEEGQANDVLYFAMPFYRAGSVANLLQQRSDRLPLLEATKIVLECLRALHYAHTKTVISTLRDGTVVSSRGIVHRDLKPHNILLSSTGQPALADFGLAKAFQAAGYSSVTVTGTVGGTIPFMPKEQALNFKAARPISDVWSMAATLYVMLTGIYPRDPLPGLTEWEVVEKCPPVPIQQRDPSIPPRVARVIDHALAQEPADRISDAAEFHRELEAAI